MIKKHKIKSCSAKVLVIIIMSGMYDHLALEDYVIECGKENSRICRHPRPYCNSEEFNSPGINLFLRKHSS
jgi:hypothetical protein